MRVSDIFILAILLALGELVVLFFDIKNGKSVLVGLSLGWAVVTIARLAGWWKP